MDILLCTNNEPRLKSNHLTLCYFSEIRKLFHSCQQSAVSMMLHRVDYMMKSPLCLNLRENPYRMYNVRASLVLFLWRMLLSLTQFNLYMIFHIVTKTNFGSLKKLLVLFARCPEI